jgi:hypothetical protein
MARRYLIPQSTPSDPEFIKELMTGMHSMLIHHGVTFDLKNVTPPRPDVRYWWYAETHGNGAIVVTDDHKMPPYGTPVRYLSVQGSDKFVEACSGWIEKYVPFIPVSELQRAVQENGEVEPQFLVLLALAVGDTPDPTSLKLIREAMRSEDDAVRFTAVFVGSLVPWEELTELLQERRQQDSSPEVRKLAENVLAARATSPRAG